jgi:quinol monooxygenase YgiN
MKIVVQAVVDLDPARRAEALATAQPWIEGALSQHGCLAYSWCADPHRADRIHVFEEWDSAAALAKHLAGPKYQGMLGHVSSFGITAAVSRKFEVAREGPVYNTQGAATAEFDPA